MAPSPLIFLSFAVVTLAQGWDSNGLWVPIDVIGKESLESVYSWLERPVLLNRNDSSCSYSDHHI